MKIPINNSRSVLEIQEAFSHMFPYLKMEFSPRIASRRSAPVKTASRLIRDYRSGDSSGEVYISPYMTVSELEQLFWNAFELDIRIFRKSGRIWLETGLTHEWTLEKQNNEGESISRTLDRRNLMS